MNEPKKSILLIFKNGGSIILFLSSYGMNLWHECTYCLISSTN